MEFKDQPVQDILLVLAEVSGASIVSDETVSGNASFFFAETDVRVALKSFLSSKKMYMREEAGIIYVSRIDLSAGDPGKFSLHADDVDPQLLLKALSRVAGKTILFDSLPRSTVTINAENLPLDSLVEIIITRFPEYSLVSNKESLYVKKKDASGSSGALPKGKGISRGSDGLYTLDFEQYRLNDALSVLFSLENREYFSMLRGDIVLERMRFASKTFTDSLRLLLEQAGADFTEKEGMLYIFEVQKKDIAKKLRSTEIIDVKYFPVQELVSLLPQELSNSSFFKIDKTSNSVILTGSKQETAPIKEFIARIDIPIEGKKMEAFRLNFIKAKDFIALLPQRAFPLSPIISPDEYLFIAAVYPETKAEIDSLIARLDRKAASVPVMLKYLKTEDLLKTLPPSINKEDIVDSGFPGLVFFVGPEERRMRFLLELAAMDRPKPQIKYDILVTQSELGDSLNYSFSLDASKDDGAGKPFVLAGKFSELLNISFDVVSEFGYLFASQLNASIGKQSTKIYTDTTLTGLNGQDIKFQNTNTYRYRDYEIDEDTGKTSTTGITREVTSGLQVALNGWVSGDGMVTMNVSTSVSELASDASESSTKPPGTSERIVTAQLRTPVGVPVPITGLIQRKKTKSEVKFPILGDIPLLGMLFTNTKTSDEESEFNMYIVPRLVFDLYNTEDIGARMSEVYQLVSVRP